MSLRILDPGPLALIEDLGRPGLAHLGVSPSGALDRGALRLGNRLLGNDEACAGLELLFGGFSARFEQPAWFAVTGAVAPLLLDGRPMDLHRATHAETGQVLQVRDPMGGARSYLTVRGGFAPDRVLGSASCDVLSGLGPEPLKAGDTVPFGQEPDRDIPFVDFVPVLDPAEGTVELRASRGPRADWFTPAAREAFFTAEWSMSTDGNRIGARLEPPRIPAHARGVDPAAFPALERAVLPELPSEPMVAGSVQVSPDGRPTVLLADHPVTGGYPVIAVVADASLDAIAQLRPGQRVSFRHG